MQHGHAAMQKLCAAKVVTARVCLWSQHPYNWLSTTVIRQAASSQCTQCAHCIHGDSHIEAVGAMPSVVVFVPSDGLEVKRETAAGASRVARVARVAHVACALSGGNNWIRSLLPTSSRRYGLSVCVQELKFCGLGLWMGSPTPGER